MLVLPRAFPADASLKHVRATDRRFPASSRRYCLPSLSTSEALCSLASKYLHFSVARSKHFPVSRRSFSFPIFRSLTPFLGASNSQLFLSTSSFKSLLVGLRSSRAASARRAASVLGLLLCLEVFSATRTCCNLHRPSHFSANGPMLLSLAAGPSTWCSSSLTPTWILSFVSKHFPILSRTTLSPAVQGWLESSTSTSSAGRSFGGHGHDHHNYISAPSSGGGALLRMHSGW